MPARAKEHDFQEHVEQENSTVASRHDRGRQQVQRHRRLSIGALMAERHVRSQWRVTSQWNVSQDQEHDASPELAALSAAIGLGRWHSLLTSPLSPPAKGSSFGEDLACVEQDCLKKERKLRSRIAELE